MSNRIVKAQFREHLRKVSEANVEKYKKSQKEKSLKKIADNKKKQDDE